MTYRLCPNSGTLGLIVRNFLSAPFHEISRVFSVLWRFGIEIAPPAIGMPNQKALKTNELAI
jgi:hypothetical protein